MFLFDRKSDINISEPQYKEIIKAIRKKEKEDFKKQHHRKLTQRQIKRLIFVLIIFIIIITTNIIISVMLYLHQPKMIEREIIKFRHITGENINKEIYWHFQNGYSDIVYDFYEDIIGSRENTIALINSALLHGIPLHKSIAQSWVESTHKATAIGYNRDENGKIRSIDMGLKQGNQYTFPNDPLNKMLDPVYNLSRCDAYYRMQYEIYHKRDPRHGWNRATIAYNRGKYLDEDGLIYLQKVLNYEEYLDEQFNLYFPIIN